MKGRPAPRYDSYALLILGAVAITVIWSGALVWAIVDLVAGIFGSG
jgi:hypothetical protein